MKLWWFKYSKEFLIRSLKFDKNSDSSFPHQINFDLLYSNDLSIYALILTMHLVVYYRIYWIYNSLNILFLIFTYCNVIYFIFPIIPLTFLLMKKYKKKIMNVLKLITFILLIISLLFGLIISIVLLINTINSKLFCKECPFSLSIDHLNALFNTYYDKRSLDGDTKNLCYRRRCILDQENMDEKFPFVYLCN